MKPNATTSTILIIEDNIASLNVMTKLLEKHGFSVLVAEDGEVGLQRANYVQPDIILLDILLPDINGFEVCRRLKAAEQTQHIPVIFLTALTEIEDKLKGFQAGGIDYITKPIQEEEVLARISTHLRLRELTERLEQKVQERTQELTALNQQLQQEITERKRVEAALRESEKKYRTYINNSPEGIFVVDSQGNYVEVNPAACQITGYTEAELLNLSISHLAAPEALDTVMADFNRLLTEEKLSAVALCQRKDESRFYLSIEAAKIAENRFIGFCLDITERRQLEERYYQAQKMEAIGQLAGGVSHDFNNILTAIMGHASLPLDMEMLPPDHPVCADLQGIQKNAERAAGLTRQLLAFARRQIIEPRTVNLNDLILNMDKMLRRLISEDIELVTLPAPDLRQVRADPGQIEQVLINLAVNARDAMPNGGTLTIETTNVTLDNVYASKHVGVEPGEYVMLTVSDTGQGMTAEVRSRIFEPFFSTKEDTGTGLGLTTCYGIVKQNGGHIWAYSEINQGTVFKVYLPYSSEDVDSASECHPSPTQSGGTETILLVEDETSVRELAARTLRQHGYTVLEAANGEKALRLVEARPELEIHLLLTDVVMPLLGGQGLAQKLSAIRPDLKILFMSGYTDNAIVQRGVLNVGIAFVQKPFLPTALARKVREVLDA